MAGKTRRSKEQILVAKIEKYNAEIEKCNEKIESLTEEKNALDKELADIRELRAKAEREKKMNELISLMDQKGYTIEDLEKLMSMPKPVVDKETEE